MLPVRHRKLPMIYQAESSECSLACLAMVAGYYGLDISLMSLRERFPISLKGATLRDVVELADKIDLATRSVRCEVPALTKLQLPVLLHWDFEHFVVLGELRNGVYVVHDPGQGVLRLSVEDVSNHFTGIAVQLAPKPSFHGGSVGERLTLPGLLRGSRGVFGYIAQVVWVTIFLELFALLSPLLLKTVIDTGLAKRDFDFVTALAVGFTGVALLHGAMTLARDYVLLRFASAFNAQFMSYLFGRMLRLPLSFYSKRSTGDLIDRYQSTNAVRQILVGSLPRVLLDGIIAIASLAIIFSVSGMLAAIALTTFLTCMCMRIGMHRRMRALTEKAIKARSEENGHVIETLRGMQPIKIFAKEHERMGAWSNHYTRLINAEMKCGLTASFQTALKVLILGLDTATSVYFGAVQVAADQISIGLLFALFVYKAQFTVKSMALAEQVLELRLVGLHLGRLAEIALSPPEQVLQKKRAVSCADFDDFRIEVDSVTAKYGPIDSPVLSSASLQVDKGDFIAIIGPSGSGKTTIFKLLLGLMEHADGQIRFNGRDLLDYDLQQYRRHFGVVMQEDMLLSGTILDNIAFFEANPDETKARRCAQIAMILDEIEAMPMKFNSRIGDLGSALSGGQKQRILLARALYHEPSVILLDEGTANLDDAVERKLLDNLSALGLTCLSIAHRPETIMRASKIYQVQAGTIYRVPAVVRAATKPAIA